MNRALPRTVGAASKTAQPKVLARSAAPAVPPPLVVRAVPPATVQPKMPAVPPPANGRAGAAATVQPKVPRVPFPAGGRVGPAVQPKMPAVPAPVVTRAGPPATVQSKMPAVPPPCGGHVVATGTAQPKMATPPRMPAVPSPCGGRVAAAQPLRAPAPHRPAVPAPAGGRVGGAATAQPKMALRPGMPPVPPPAGGRVAAGVTVQAKLAGPGVPAGVAAPGNVVQCGRNKGGKGNWGGGGGRNYQNTRQNLKSNKVKYRAEPQSRRRNEGPKKKGARGERREAERRAAHDARVGGGSGTIRMTPMNMLVMYLALFSAFAPTVSGQRIEGPRGGGGRGGGGFRGYDGLGSSSGGSSFGNSTLFLVPDSGFGGMGGFGNTTFDNSTMCPLYDVSGFGHGISPFNATVPSPTYSPLKTVICEPVVDSLCNGDRSNPIYDGLLQRVDTGCDHLTIRAPRNAMGACVFQQSGVGGDISCKLLDDYDSTKIGHELEHAFDACLLANNGGSLSGRVAVLSEIDAHTVQAAIAKLRIQNGESVDARDRELAADFDRGCPVPALTAPMDNVGTGMYAIAHMYHRLYTTQDLSRTDLLDEYQVKIRRAVARYQDMTTTGQYELSRAPKYKRIK